MDSKIGLRGLGVLVLLVFAGAVGAQEVPAKLPEGSVGIAAQYPGDAGIATDERVIFVEDFSEASLEQLFARWENLKERESLSLVSDTPAGSADPQSLLVTHVGGEGEGGHLYRRLLPGHDRVFLRYYIKFDPDCAQIHHLGPGIGGYQPATPWPMGGAGERPNGAERFTTHLDPFGTSWTWDFYAYWMGMPVHGDGNYWGAAFMNGGARPKVERGRWICIELMLKVNDPVDAKNGELACWIDGKLLRHEGQVASHVGPGFPRGEWSGGWWYPVADSDAPFEGFQWRSDPALNVNYLWTYVYITKAPRGHVSRIWFDNIVVAREYIGPMHPRAGQE